MRISKGAKRRAIKQQLYLMLKSEGRGYYFGDAKTQREVVGGAIDAINARVSANGTIANPQGMIDGNFAIRSLMRRIGKFYGLKNRYRGAGYLGPIRTAALEMSNV